VDQEVKKSALPGQSPPAAMKNAALPSKPTGKSLVAGTLVQGDPTGSFCAINPSMGSQAGPVYNAASPQAVERACAQAWAAFYSMQERSAADRAMLLDSMAEHVLMLGDALIETAISETGLQPQRLISERERVVSTLRLFANVVREGQWVRASIDKGDPSRKPVPKPDLRRMLRPLGPVAVFGASNFPLAYSAMGTDSSSALAAGCPVVVKGHPSHPGTGELVAHSVAAAIASCGFHPGTFSYLQAGGVRELQIGRELVQNACIRAVGFTGSFSGGMALSALAREREDPIPVFAEMGSINPVFVLPHAMDENGKSIAEKLYHSVTGSVGQMCTKPGVIFAVRGDGYVDFEHTLIEMANKGIGHTMLSRRIQGNFAKRLSDIAAIEGVEIRGGSLQTAMLAQNVPTEGPVSAVPALLKTKFETFAKHATLRDECFGPSVILVVCERSTQLFEAATLFRGSLTGTIFAGPLDATLAKQLHQALDMRVGRLVYNGVPTGVEVAASMVHGGPFPSTNQPHATAVGPLALERWCRPVCYQNAPEPLLPPELRG
jgi:2,5-dioxopentanoate dehydrogenase